MRPTIGITGAPFGANARSELQGSRNELAALGSNGHVTLSSTIENGTSLTATIPLRGR